MRLDVKSTLLRGAAAGVLVSAALAGTAAAQSATTNAAQFNGGYGRTQGTENIPFRPSTRDANRNRIIVDGVIQTGDDNSTFVRGDSAGSGAAYAGGAGSTAIGNNLVVITQGSWNTVIVNSNQVNNGNVTANSTGSVPAKDSVINGEIDLND
jgi:holdfast attachment protein HfaA